MVFSSFPVYLDHPNLHQFQQQSAGHQQQGSSITSHVDHSIHLQPPPPPPQPPQLAVAGGGGGGGVGGSSIRPGSMVDRARLAKLPLPEAGLKCPRCDSTNTKFCYFNNYSLSQPRHFCKTCRRYWTRGGALRNVPVGGGCRRNKKTKSGGAGGSKTSNSSIAATADHQQRQQMGSNNMNSTNTPAAGSPSRCSPSDITGHLPNFMAAFQNLNHYGGGGVVPTIGGFQAQLMASTTGNGSLGNMGFNLGGNIHLGASGNGNGNGNDLSISGGGTTHEQWRLPNIGGFETQPSLFPLIRGEGVVEEASSSMGITTSSEVQVLSHQNNNIPSVRREENHAAAAAASRLNLTKQFLVNSDQNNQFWGGSPNWTGFSGLNSSSTSHLL